jgi:putative component of membrane protein insertase Oxa1/YidC/SpoIIIJ protein YidD
MVIIITIMSLIFSGNIVAQVADDLYFITRHNQITHSEYGQVKTKIFDETSEIKLLSLVFLRFYQIFISSQQDNKKICIFTPSCSRFSLSAIKKYGIVQGTLMTSDRLQRCNNFGRKNYHFNLETGKFDDPVDHYYLKIF